MTTEKAVSVFGMGKVGVTLAMALCRAGYRVVGVDVVPSIIAALADGTFTTTEPGVMDIYKTLPKGQFTATMNADEAIDASDVSLVIVPTPSNVLGGFSNAYILQSIATIGAAIKKKKGPHTVSIISTCLPGSSQMQLVPALEKAAGRVLGQGLGFCYNPSFIAQGDVMKGLVQPDYVLIGEADKASGDAVEAVYRRMVLNDAPVVRMSTAEAEITKIASNTHETMRVAFANMILGLCNELPGADVDKITHALGYRLGRRFFKGAVPYGGPCWPRDNVALSEFMDMLNSPSTLPRAIDRSNLEHGRYVLRSILARAPRGAKVGLIGLAYKPGTWMVDRSFGVDLAAWLKGENRDVVCWDPEANASAAQVLGNSVIFAKTAEDCFAADVVVVLLPLAGLDKLNWAKAKTATVIDCWRVLPESVQKTVGAYIPLGRMEPAQNLWDPASDKHQRFTLLTN